MASDYKYTLIVSQYDYSRHMYLVKFDPITFIESAKNFTAELQKYKRDGGDTREIEFGDLKYFKESDIASRYNVNDQGDIYFINAVYSNYLMGESIEYYDCSRRESAGFKKKSAKEAIREHHNGLRVMEILKKHFDIA